MATYISTTAVGNPEPSGAIQFVPFAIAPHQDAGAIPGCVAVQLANGKFRNVDPATGIATDDRTTAGSDERFLVGANGSMVAIPSGTQASAGFIFPTA